MREYYTYNESGDRITKKHEDSTVTPAVTEITEYPNRYTGVVMDASGSGKVTTKNIYVGPQIMASVMKSGPANSDTFTYTYYYHTDHLGSSTYLTDDTGAIKEHIEYTPWGESWYEPASTNLVLPNYKYTGKEQDATKLYYYGARYYDPQTSVWQSTDPILGEYLESDRKGGDKGVFNSKNLGLHTYCDGGGKGIFDSKKLALFSYCGQNPLIFIDPDGRDALYFGRGDGVLSQKQATAIGAAWAQSDKNVQGAAILAGAGTIAVGSIVSGIGLIGVGEVASGVFSVLQGTAGVGVIGAEAMGVDGLEGVGASSSLAGVALGLITKDPKMFLMNSGALMSDLSQLPDSESNNNTALAQPFSEIVNQSVQNDAIIKGNISKEQR
jgi:RHS repeat-associated protein